MRHWAFKALGEKIYREPIGEMKHADLTLETGARNDAAAAITLFEGDNDYVSRDLATKILVDSEEHIDYLETQSGLAKLMGELDYAQWAAGELAAGE